MKRLSLAILAAAGAAAGGVAGRRLLNRATERVDLYFEDGSMISLDADSPDSQRLLPIARDLLSVVG